MMEYDEVVEAMTEYNTMQREALRKLMLRRDRAQRVLDRLNENIAVQTGAVMGGEAMLRIITGENMPYEKTKKRGADPNQIQAAPAYMTLAGPAIE